MQISVFYVFKKFNNLYPKCLKYILYKYNENYTVNKFIIIKKEKKSETLETNDVFNKKSHITIIYNTYITT